MFLAAETAQLLRDPHRFESLVERHGGAPVVSALMRHGVAPYVAWQRPDLDVLAQVRRDAILQDALQEAELRRVCSALRDAGVSTLVLKGAAWALTVYPASWCRPRGDLDLLIAVQDRERAQKALTTVGYVREERLTGALANFQDAFVRPVGGGYRCAVDLHWEVANRLAIVQRLPAAALFARSAPLHPLGDHVRQLGKVDAILLAAIHPLTHHPDEVELKWWLDIVQLAPTLTSAEVTEVEERASALGVAGLVAFALTEARRCAPVPAVQATVLQEAWISRLSARGIHEETSAFLQSGRGKLDDLVSDLGSLVTWRARWRLLREHLLPPASFMLRTHGSPRRVWLPWLYAQRAVGGAVRWVGAWARKRVSRFRA